MFDQPIGLLFVGRNTLQLYPPNATSVLTCEIPQSLIKDVDVVNKDGLYTFIKQWVRQHTVNGLPLVMILSEGTYFEQVFPISGPPQLETDILKFIDNVPFESIKTKIYDLPKEKRVVVVNKLWLEALMQGFVLQGFLVKAVVPASALGELSTKTTLDQQIVEYVTKNMDAVLKQNLMDASENTGGETPKKNNSTQAKNKNLPLLLGVFGVLIFILGIVIVTQLL